MSDTKETKQKPKFTKPNVLMSLEQANQKAKAQFSGGTNANEVFIILLANKGKALSPVELAEKIGETVTPKNVRNAMQKNGLSKHQNAVIEADLNGKRYWIHLTKLTGGRNAYKLTNKGTA